MKILIIEDSPEERELLELMLGGKHSVAGAPRLCEARRLAADFRPDVVLLDLHLPDSQGLDTLREAARWTTAPIVVLTSQDSEELGLEAVGTHAEDYLVKGRADERTLLRSLSFAQARHQLRVLETELHSLTTHDLKNSLSAILSAVTFLRSLEAEGRLLDPAVPTLLELAERQTRHMAAQIDRFVELQGLRTGRFSLDPREFDPARTVDEVTGTLKDMAALKSIALKKEGPAMTLEADPRRFAQVVENLLSNALRVTPEKGTVGVRWGPGFWLEVWDTGPGLPEDVEQLFLLGRSLGSGTGLGLATARLVAELHGGTLTARNRAERGAVFRLEI